MIQLDIQFSGNTTLNKITLSDNLADQILTKVVTHTLNLLLLTIEQIVFGQNTTFNGTTIADLGTVTTADINGGTMDGVTFG